MASAGKAAAGKLAHYRIQLLADGTLGQQRLDDIVAALCVCPQSVSRVRQRFVTLGFDAALDHKFQPTRSAKAKIGGGVRQQLVRIACGNPPEGRCRWTLQLLADEVVALGLAKSVSIETAIGL